MTVVLVVKCLTVLPHPPPRYRRESQILHNPLSSATSPLDTQTTCELLVASLAGPAVLYLHLDLVGRVAGGYFSGC